MPITQIPDKNVVPRVPKIYVYLNATAASGTYYTLVNSTGVRGRLTKVTLAYDNAANSNTFLNIRITVDGVISTLSNISGAHAALGLPHNIGTGAVTYDATKSWDYFADVTFFNDIKVEVMQNVGSNASVIANVMYSQETA